MIIDINNFADGEIKKVSFKKNISIPEDYNVNGEAYVNVYGEILNSGGKFRFTGNICAKFNVNCDLCLKPFDIELNCNADEIFIRSDETDNDETDCWTFSEKTVNLEPAVLSNIILNIPMRFVCSDECKGLCGICGHNFNDGDCGCGNSYINPNFEKLKALFEENEEEV